MDRDVDQLLMCDESEAQRGGGNANRRDPKHASLLRCVARDMRRAVLATHTLGVKKKGPEGEAPCLSQ
jgi:hypothetical protein